MENSKISRQLILKTMAILLGVFLFACGKKQDAAPVTPATKDTTKVIVADTFTHYNATISPIINKYCVSCHGQGYAYPFQTYTLLKGAADNGSLNDRLFVKKDMPPSGYARPSKTELNSIKKWISDGCKE